MSTCIVTDLYVKESTNKEGRPVKIQNFKLSTRGYEYPAYFSLVINEKNPLVVLYGTYDVVFDFGYYLKEEPDSIGELRKVRKPAWRVASMKPVTNGKA